jgi:hypothetical protein
MARTRIAKLPTAMVSGRRHLCESDIKWKSVEASYGKPIPPKLRDEVFKLTASFVDFAPFELTAEPVSDARKQSTS